MIKVNIGTTLGNLQNVEFDKPLEDITYIDIKKVVNEEFGTNQPVQIFGWGPASDENLKTKK